MKRILTLFQLAVIQGGNALFPLFAFPYILIKVGDGAFSKIVLSEALAMYVLTFSLYSYDITGVSEIIGKVKTGKTADVLAVKIKIIMARLFVFSIISGVISVFIYIFDRSLIWCFILWLMLPLGTIFQSNFFHQATNSNKTLALLVTFFRVTSLIILLVSDFNKNDIYFIIFVMSASYLASGLITFFSSLIKYRRICNSIKIAHPSEIFMSLKNGFVLFLSNICVILYRNSNVVILGLVSTPSAVAMYATAEKIIKSIQALSGPLNQFYFTRLVHSNISASKLIDYPFFKKIWDNTKWQLAMLSLVISCVVLLIVELANLATFAKNIINVTPLLVIMSFSIFVGVCNYMFGVVGMSLVANERLFLLFSCITGCISIGVALLLSYKFGQFGAAVSYVMAEITLFFFVMSFYFRRVF